MTKKNPHIGSTFESWLDEVGLREEVTAAAVKSVIAAQIGDEMKKQRITKARMAKMMETSRAQIDRLSSHSYLERRLAEGFIQLTPIRDDCIVRVHPAAGRNVAAADESDDLQPVSNRLTAQ